MKVGFTGTREGMTGQQLESFQHLVRRLAPDEFHHGACIGADHEAHMAIVRIGMIHPVVHPPLSKKFAAVIHNLWGAVFRPEQEYLLRDRNIVDETDVLIGVPKDIRKRTGGTWYTVGYAGKRGKPIFLICPNGSIRFSDHNTPSCPQCASIIYSHATAGDSRPDFFCSYCKYGWTYGGTGGIYVNGGSLENLKVSQEGQK